MEYLITDNGINVAFSDVNRNSNMPVVLIHGWPVNHTMFEYQTEMLAEMGYRVIGVDLRGYGMSDEVGYNSFSYNLIVNDIYRIISRLKLNNVILAGFSMGGAIAVRYMSLTKGFRISKLCLIAAAVPSFVQREGYPCGMTCAKVNEMIAHTMVDRPQVIRDFGMDFFASEPTEAFKECFESMCMSASGTGTIAGLRSLRDEDLRTELSSVKVPTGIFHGKKDKICPYEFALIMQKSIENSRLFTFENSGHAVFYDELGEFNARLMEFIA